MYQIDFLPLWKFLGEQYFRFIFNKEKPGNSSIIIYKSNKPSNSKHTRNSGWTLNINMDKMKRYCASFIIQRTSYTIVFCSFAYFTISIFTSKNKYGNIILMTPKERCSNRQWKSKKIIYLLKMTLTLMSKTVDFFAVIGWFGSSK